MFFVDKRWQSNFKDKKPATTNNEHSQSNENMKISKQVSTLAGSQRYTLNILCGGLPIQCIFNLGQNCLYACVCIFVCEWEWVIEMMTFIAIQLLFMCQFGIHSMHRFLHYEYTNRKKKSIIFLSFPRFSIKWHISC